MEEFRKIELPNVTKVSIGNSAITIENQDIRDEGVEALCSNTSMQRLS